MAETQTIYGPLAVNGPLILRGGVLGSSSAGTAASPIQAIRARFTTAQVNAGATILAALTYGKYRLIDAIMIAVGGAAATATSVRIAGTQSAAAAQLVTQAVAGLTQSTPARLDTAAKVLADGASFVACDINTPITINANGTLTGATSIDVILIVAVDPA